MTPAAAASTAATTVDARPTEDKHEPGSVFLTHKTQKNWSQQTVQIEHDYCQGDQQEIYFIFGELAKCPDTRHNFTGQQTNEDHSGQSYDLPA